MIKVTPEELIRYLYNETTAEENLMIEQAIENDWTVREKMAVVKASMQRLNNIVEGPRTEVILEIMNYAREKSTQQIH